MPNALMCSQSGGGFGHVQKLLPIALALEDNGFSPAFILNNPDEASPLLAAHPFPVVQAPAPPVAPRRRQPTSRCYPRYLQSLGFDDPEELLARLAVWDDVMEPFRPSLIVCDTSPTVALAALGRTPLITVGTGFTLPPPDRDTFPGLPGMQEPTGQDELLRSVAEAQRGRGRPIPRALPAILAGAGHYVCTTELLDPYAAWRRVPAAGPLVRQLPAPASEGHGYFAYLAGDAEQLEVVLEGLATCGLPGTLYIRSPTEAVRSLCRRRHLELLERPASMSTALAASRVLVHHGGVQTCEQALFAGRPQLLLPRHVEQGSNAARLVAAGVAVMLRTSRASAREIAACVRWLGSDPGCARAAQQRAADTSARYPQGSLDRVVQQCLSVAA